MSKPEIPDPEPTGKPAARTDEDAAPGRQPLINGGAAVPGPSDSFTATATTGTDPKNTDLKPAPPFYTPRRNKPRDIPASDPNVRPSEAGVLAVTSPKAEGVEPEPVKRRGGRIVAVLLLGLILIGGGFWLGKATTDPKASEEYVALEDIAQTTTKQRDVYIEQRDALQEQIEQQEDDMITRETAVSTAETALKTRESESATKIAEQQAAVKKREDAVAGAEQKQAANTIADGTWVVGVDIEPGVYRTKSGVGSSCYWAILTTGTNGDDIIANDIPGGGFPTVTLAAGQDFKSSRCGSWAKQ